MLEKINQELIKALKAKKELRVMVLRSVKNSINNEMIAMKKKEEGLTNEEAIAVLKREAKKRKEAAQAYEAGGRPEQTQQELDELVIIEEFLPVQLSEAAVSKIVEEVIKQQGSVTAQDFGRVMGAVMKKIGSQADGTIVSRVLKEKLA